MPIGRAIVAVALAVAVALLPASAGAAFAAKTDAAHSRADATTEITTVSGADHAMPCDHSESGVDDCGSISVCALKCFTYAGTQLPSLAAPLSAIRAVPAIATDNRDSRGGVPPFRPPRS